MSALLAAIGAGLVVLAIRPSRVSAGTYLGATVAERTRRLPARVPIGAVWGAGTGLLAALMAPARLPVLAVLGAGGGALMSRAAASTRRQRRARRLAQELPTIADTLALHVLAGDTVSAAVRRVSTACRGVAAEELAAAAADADGLEAGLRRAAASTTHPEGARLYELLEHAHRTGGRLTEALGDLAADYRNALADALTAEGGRRALAVYGPILAFMIPVTLVFLMYPTLAGLSALSTGP